MRDWKSLYPGDLGIVNKQFVLGIDIIEEGHFFIAYDYKLLFLVGMKPGDKDMGFDTACKFEVCDCDIGDIGVEVVSSVGGDFRWHFLKEIEDDGNVMGGKAPENVFLCAEFS